MPDERQPAEAADTPDSVEVEITSLEMCAPPDRAPRPAPRGGLQVIHAASPPIHYYRYLYGAVGAPWHWVDRNHLSDARLSAIVGDPRVEIHVLHVAGVPAGYAELDRRAHIGGDGDDPGGDGDDAGGEIELAYFGLIAEFIGRGLGGFFLDWAVQKAWSYAPSRLWLHTCTLDHPAALPCYQRAGFSIFQRRRAMQRLR